jgi:hypothetical protein
MASPDQDDAATSDLAALAEFLEDPEDARRRLPSVVGMLDSDDEQVRLAAAWTCCLAAVTQEDTVDYIVRRLTDRLTDDDVSLELTQTLDYLAARYPETVSEVLTALEAENDNRDGLPFPRPGNMTRSYYYGTELKRDGVGRTRYPGEEGDDPRRTDGSDDDRKRAPGDDAAGAVDDGEGEGEEGDEDEQGGATGSARDDQRGRTGEAKDDGNPREVAQRTMDVSPVAVRSRFEKLHIVSSRERQRFARNYEALVGSGGEELAVMFRMLRRPGSVPDLDFEADIERELRRWDANDDHGHVVRVLDWGLDPQPWLVTMFTGTTLADQDRPTVDRALTDARNLAAATSHLHQHDVVHGGIDPESVAYPDHIIAGGDRLPPLLDNVGMMHVYRFHFEPSTLLDPRYAAPEYFDRAFGRIDHLTDIYQLGAVIYTLFTGRPPFAGTTNEVREQVTTGDPPQPSAVDDDVPAAVDAVVAKAMATQKLRRYESVEHMRQELAAIDGGETVGL